MSMMNKSVNSGVMSAGIKTMSSVVDVCNGKKTVGEAAGDVVVAGAKGAATTVTTGVVTSVVTSSVIVSPVVVAAAPVVIGSAIVYGVGKLLGRWFWLKD